MDEKVFFNGELIAASLAKVSVFDGGFLHGAGLFETMRAYAQKVYRLDEHMDRLLESAKKLTIPVASDKNDLKEAVAQTIKANGLQEARVRLTVSWGDLRNEPNGTILITASQFKPYPEEFYTKGMSVLVTDNKISCSDPVARHKSTNYLARLTVLRQAQQLKAGEALWFTESNHLAEGCISNVFLVKNNKLLTPGLDEPILPGITRAIVLELARAEKMDASEQEITIDDLLGADEVFLSNSVMEIMPVSRFENHTVGDGQPGEMTKYLAGLYKQDVEKKCQKDSSE